VGIRTEVMVSTLVLRVKRLFEALAEKAPGDSVVWLILLIPTLLISCYDVSGSGPLWADAPQYANAGAMIRDWLFSGDIFEPYEFAKANYVQYPAFHLPYHPPVYPGLLSLFFAVTGVSYFSARLFIAASLWVAVCFFYAILRERQVGRADAFVVSLLFLTIPEIAYWSRDTMSEVPALALIVAGSYFFLVWFRTGRLLHYWVAFAFAEAAFLSRYITAGVLLAWLLWIVLEGRFRKTLSPFTVIPPGLFLIINAGWVMFALRFSKFETPLGGVTPNTNYVEAFSWEVISYFATQLPTMIGTATLIVTLVGVAWALFVDKKYRSVLFWLAWILGYWVFLMTVGIYNERRYFIFALPALSGLVTLLFSRSRNNGLIRHLPLVLVGLCIVSNVRQIIGFPRGVVGYESVATHLARLEAPGNVLLASWLDSDLIFRYRSHSPSQRRLLIRGDRSLTIRPPSYTDAQPVVVAVTADDVLSIIHLGRVRYLITCAPTDPTSDTRAAEMVLLHDTLRSQPNRFLLLAEFPLLSEQGIVAYRGKVFLWEFRGELPDGPSEIPVQIPTADMHIKLTF